MSFKNMREIKILFGTFYIPPQKELQKATKIDIIHPACTIQNSIICSVGFSITTEHGTIDHCCVGVLGSVHEKCYKDIGYNKIKLYDDKQLSVHPLCRAPF